MGTFLLLAGGLFVIIAVVVVVASVSSVIGAVAGEVEDSDEDQDYYNTIFTKDDVPGYESFDSHDCPLCQANMPVDAVSNGYGYSKL